MLFPAVPSCSVDRAIPTSTFFDAFEARGSGEPHSGQHLNLGRRSVFPHLGHCILLKRHGCIFMAENSWNFLETNKTTSIVDGTKAVNPPLCMIGVKLISQKKTGSTLTMTIARWVPREETSRSSTIISYVIESGAAGRVAREKPPWSKAKNTKSNWEW